MKEGLSEHMFNRRITSELQHLQNFKKCDHFVTLATSAMRSAKTWCFQNLWIKTTVLATDRSSITMTDIVLAMVTDVSTHTIPCHTMSYHAIPYLAIPYRTMPMVTDVSAHTCLQQSSAILTAHHIGKLPMRRLKYFPVYFKQHQSDYTWQAAKWSDLEA